MSERRVNLHLAHSWGGGLGYWVQDFSRADRNSLNLVLESYGTSHCYGIGHRLRNGCTGEILDGWTLSEPIAEVRETHTVYRQRLNRVVERYDVGHLYVSSLIGHSLDVFRLELPTLRIHHDFFPYCPALHCHFGGLCTVCQREHLEACRDHNPHFRPINSAGFHIGLRSSLLEVYRLPHVIHVVPTSTVAHQYTAIDERFRDLTFHIIEHGIDLPSINLFGGADEGRRLRVGMLGHLGWVKGVDVFRRELERLRLVVDIVLLGSGDASPEFARRWAVEVVPEYDRTDLPNILGRLRLDLALFLSIVPETYSYTLSEVWFFGIPPIAHGVGAFTERIRHGVNGFLFRLEDDSLLDELLRLDGNRVELRAVAHRLAQADVRTAKHMVDDYYELPAGGSLVTKSETEATLCDHRHRSCP